MFTPTQTSTSENFIIHPLVPKDAHQGWKLEYFEITETIPTHYHKVQRQFIISLNGQLLVSYDKEKQANLLPGEFVVIEPGVTHSLIPHARSQFLALDFPGFIYPEDVFYNAPSEQIPWRSLAQTSLPSIDEKYFGKKIDNGNYSVYNIVTGNVTEGRWSAALIEFTKAPKHVHKIEKELFAVVYGTLDIVVDTQHHVLTEGELIAVLPGQIHELRSVNNTPVRVLCFNFPAFDPSDMHLIPNHI